MFVPRQVKLKGASATARDGCTGPSTRSTRTRDEDSTEVSVDSLVSAHQHADDEPPRKLRRLSAPSPSTDSPTNQDYLEQLVIGVELILSDYAHIDTDSQSWLRQHQRAINGEDGYIHLSSLLLHPALSTLKPPPTQPALRLALQQHLRLHLPLSTPPRLALTPSATHVRRTPSSLENLRFIAKSNWERHCSVYVEPHLPSLCRTPAKLVWLLWKHWKAEGLEQVRARWWPVQRVVGGRGWAWLVLAGEVEGVEEGWEGVWPKGWIVLSRAEHERRTEEYVSLLAKEREALRVFQSAHYTHIASDSSRGSRQHKHLRPPSVPQDRRGTLLTLTNIPPTASAATISSWVAKTTHRHRTRKTRAPLSSAENVGVAYVDYELGDTSAVIRLMSKEDTGVVLEAVNARSHAIGTREGTSGAAGDDVRDAEEDRAADPDGEAQESSKGPDEESLVQQQRVHATTTTTVNSSTPPHPRYTDVRAARLTESQEDAYWARVAQERKWKKSRDGKVGRRHVRPNVVGSGARAGMTRPGLTSSGVRGVVTKAEEGLDRGVGGSERSGGGGG